MGIKFIHKQPKPYLSAFAPDRFRGNLSNGTRLHEVTNAYSNFPHQIVFIGCLLREYGGKCILYRDWNNVARNVSKRMFPILNLNTFSDANLISPLKVRVQLALIKVVKKDIVTPLYKAMKFLHINRATQLISFFLLYSFPPSSDMILVIATRPLYSRSLPVMRDHPFITERRFPEPSEGTMCRLIIHAILFFRSLQRCPIKGSRLHAFYHLEQYCRALTGRCSFGQ